MTEFSLKSFPHKMLVWRVYAVPSSMIPTLLFWNIHRYIQKEIVLSVHLYQDLKFRVGKNTSWVVLVLNMLSPGFNAQQFHKTSYGGAQTKHSRGWDRRIDQKAQQIRSYWVGNSHQPCHPKSNTSHSYFATLLSLRVVKSYLVFVRAVTKTLAISYCILSF